MYVACSVPDQGCKQFGIEVESASLIHDSLAKVAASDMEFSPNPMI